MVGHAKLRDGQYCNKNVKKRVQSFSLRHNFVFNLTIYFLDKCETKSFGMNAQTRFSWYNFTFVSFPVIFTHKTVCPCGCISLLETFAKYISWYN